MPMFSKPVKTVRVGNLDPQASWEELITLFISSGHKPLIQGSFCPAADGKQIATVSFQSEREAKKALSLNGKVIGSSKIELDRDFFGLTVLASSQEPLFDVIAIHGLNGHAFATWVSADAENDSMWLRDFLAGAISSSTERRNISQARIMIYGYNSALLGVKTSVSTIRDFAKDLLQRIVDDRCTEQQMRRPIIFICYSLGGIVVKQALILAHQDPQHYPLIFRSTHSILFLATPHSGSRAADHGAVISKIAALSFQSPATQLLESLKSDSHELARLSAEFRELSSNFDIVSFYERRKTIPLGSVVVDENSAKIGIAEERTIPIDANHSEICKFSGRSHSIFTTVLAQIRRCALKAHVDIAARFQDHSVGNTSRVNTALKANGALFIVPVPENPHFQGRDKELDHLHKQLDSHHSSKCSNLPTIISVYGLGGVGKTQLVTEYVYRRKKQKPQNAIFWVSASSAEEINSQYCMLGGKIASWKNAKTQLRTSSLQGSFSNDDIIQPSNNLMRQNSVQSKSHDIGFVLNWMMAPDNEGWLLILDNLDDIGLDVTPFLPVRGAGNVIATTRDRRILGGVANSSIELQGLDFVDGELLLLRLQQHDKSAVLSNPAGHKEYPVIQHIVRELHGFPLALDQAAAFIRENSPLTFSEYAEYLKPRSEDRELLLRFKEANPKYPESIMTTWEISMRFLKAKHRQASLILELLGFLHNVKISEKILRFATATSTWSLASSSVEKALDKSRKERLVHLNDGVSFRIAIGVLVSLSLVTRTLFGSIGPALEVHPLVHEWIRLRLNDDRSYQASLVHDAGMVLYQAFPFEVLHGTIANAAPLSSTMVSSQLERVCLQIHSLVPNLREYEDPQIGTPLEIASLLAGYVLTIRQAALGERVASFFASDDTLHEIVMTLNRGSKSKCVELRRLRLLLCYTISKLSSCTTKSQWVQAATEIGNKLQSVELKESLSTRNSTFLAVFLCGIFEFVDHFGQVWASDDSSYDHIYHTNVAKILIGLNNTLMLDLKDSKFDLRLKLYVECRLVKMLSSIEYWQQSDHFLTSSISSLDLSDIETADRATYFSLCARLEWERPGVKEIDRIKGIYELLLEESRFDLENRRTLLEKERNRVEIARQALLSKVSSSEGRYGSAFVTPLPKQGFKSLEPLRFFWGSVLAVLEEISNQSSCWLSASQTQQGFISLSLSERRYALKFLRRLINLFDLVDTEKPLFYNYLHPRTVCASLAKVLENLQEWESAVRLSYSALDFRSIQSVCGGSPHKLWECKDEDQTAQFSGETAGDKLHPSTASKHQAECDDTGNRVLLSTEVNSRAQSSRYVAENTERHHKEWFFPLQVKSAQLMEQHARDAEGYMVVSINDPVAITYDILEGNDILPTIPCVIHNSTEPLIATYVNCCLKCDYVSRSVAEEAQNKLALIQGIQEPLLRALCRFRLIYDLSKSFKGSLAVGVSCVQQVKRSDFGDKHSWSYSSEATPAQLSYPGDPEGRIIDLLTIIHEFTDDLGEDLSIGDGDNPNLSLSLAEKDNEAELFFGDFFDESE